MKAVKEKDTVNEKRLKQKFDDFYGRNYSKYSDFIKEHPDSEVSLLAFSSYYHYKTDKDFDTINSLYQTLSKQIQETKRGKKIGKEIESMGIMKRARAKTAVGTPAPDFKGTTPNGETLSLKEAMGKVTIIDFWASWCGPCRKENPNVVAMYNELHGKGLNIIGVSLDKDSAKWQGAIDKDNLTWYHISNLQGWDEPIAKEFGVSSIPATVILDKNGTIVARNLRGEELKAKVLELLAQ